MDVRYLILALFFLVSCMPQATVSKGNLASTDNNGGTTSGTPGGSTSPTNLSWNYLSQLTNSISINVSNLQNAYIVGTPVESYLDDSSRFIDRNYCLITSYSIGGVSYELRTRVVPISYYDFNKKRYVKNLRVDFQDTVNSESFCITNKTVRMINTLGEHVTDPTTPPLARVKYDPSQICPLCTSMLTATRIRLFIQDDNFLNEVSTNHINTNSLSLQVDPNYSYTGDTGTCTNSSCKARGFDCCLENQCVKDGTVKPAAATMYPALLSMAEQERLTNPLAYLNYPQLYYICGVSVPPTTGGSNGGSTSGGSSGGGYEEGFAKLKKDYQCIEHIKAQTTLTPFHNEILLRNFIGTTDCLTSAVPDSELNKPEYEFHYKNVFKRLYATCGCNRTDLSDMITNCPNYDYEVTLKDSVTGEPKKIDCFTPPADAGTVPAYQSVSISGRQAPHRFFDESGVERPLSGNVTQEGDVFYYLDNGRVIPYQEPFGMNSILGQMSVTLDKALPAKEVSVELDQVYLISTTSGYYTPCPECAGDTWFAAFTAHPSSANGVGLQAIGHTTKRDEIGTNSTAGNYEDTIFGRACWIPPTMIPFSQPSTATSVVESRRDRLKTQAALYINGYQRDWYGFNKGALIGSFDGVSWFAIGKGRIVRSTSKKLFLAINAPFADLAAPTMHVVSIAAYDGNTQAAQVDYDPEYHQTHPYQNEAGNCQKYHMCETDTDCITRLGWEYSCADVKDITTNWPSFDQNANEVLENPVKNIPLYQILQQKRLVGSSTKRCVYRGSGALCNANAGNIASDNLNKRKLLTCAPNFFCANVKSGYHNNKIARYAASNLENIPVANNHYIGKDANILGRPHDYTGSNSLDPKVISVLEQNTETNLRSYLGLCQPGKALPTSDQPSLANPFNQQSAPDVSRRTDFISQIGSCNSGLFDQDRHSSCPVIGADGNYLMFATSSLPTDYSARATKQNACGLESLLSTANLSNIADMLSDSSPFQHIEAKPLSTEPVFQPTLVRDACFRRAGSVCHTDLDCSPNKMHEAQAGEFATAFFGNQAEHSYWAESLICGQADPEPLSSDSEAFKNYDMTKNRCCREVGRDLTTYTSDIPLDTRGTVYDPATEGLKMSITPGTRPNDPKRYSRLATVDDLGTSPFKPVLSANQKRSGAGLDTTITNVKTAHQWRTLSEANSETCCGGGWIRKFSDGTNDWTRTDRLSLDVTNFRCINSRSVLITSPGDVKNGYDSEADITSLVGQDYGDYCKDGTNTNGSCAQYSFLNSAFDVLPDTSVDPYDPTVVINTIKPDFSRSTNGDYYFKPRSADSDPSVIIDLNTTSSTARKYLAIKIPSFVPRKSFDDRIGTASPPTIRLEIDDGTGLNCTYDTSFDPTNPTDGRPADACGPGTGCCYYNFSRTSRILKVGMNEEAALTTFEKKKVGVTFTVPSAGSLAGITRSKPGSSTYYLKRLGLLELSGVPQITFEALTCNDNSNRIVPGIFNPAIKFLVNNGAPGVSDTNVFSQSTFSFAHSYVAKKEDGSDTVATNKHFTNHYGLAHEPVFSANDFKCCAPLGKTVTDASVCCSGFGVDIGTNGTRKTCALPPGTDLMVYFNRFISNEGRGSDKPGGGLLDADFDSQTGEPLLSSSVNDKIRALGEAYCSSGRVRQGGAFGSYEPEPQGSETNLTSRIFNIVDSARDIGQNANAGKTVEVGYNAFIQGFRWNHHLYCDEGD